jgi:RNA polymerase-binding transcription factor DksA
MDVATQTHLTTLRHLLDYRVTDLRAELHAGEREAAAELAQVEAALRRLEDGTYGDCTSCGRPIRFARLLAQPATSRCEACEALHRLPLVPTLH